MDHNKHNCRFCRLLADNDDTILFRADLWWGMLDVHPVGSGHFVLAPVRHAARLSDLTARELEALMPLVREATERFGTSDSGLLVRYNKLLVEPPTPRTKEFVGAVLDQYRTNSVTDGFTVGFNDGEAAGQTVPHFHCHVIPRFKGDVPDPTGGIRNIIPGKGDYR